MGVVHCRNPRNGIVYVYSSFSYWDKETKSKKAIRKLIGKLDEHGNVVPTNGHPGRPKKNKTPESEPVKPAAADSESVKTVATDTKPASPADPSVDEDKGKSQTIDALEERIRELESTVQGVINDRDVLIDELDKLISRFRRPSQG